MPDIVAPPTFPTICPKCAAVVTHPSFAGTVKADIMTTVVEMRCRHCRNEWQLELTRENDAGTFSARVKSGVYPKPDRRKRGG